MILIGMYRYSSNVEREKSRVKVTIDICKKTEEIAN